MSISLKSFASFVAVIGISAVGAANTALASGQGSHGSGRGGMITFARFQYGGGVRARCGADLRPYT